MRFSRMCVGLACTAIVLGASVSVARAQCSEQWFAIDGSPGGTSPGIYAMTWWDPDGAGPQAPVLVVGGPFSTAGGNPANNIATWDGTTWSTLGTGMNGEVDALAVLPSGELVAAGGFTTAGDSPANYVAKWNGTSWSALGNGMNNYVNTLAVMPNGDLVAGGFFTTAGVTAVNRVARWDGTSWSAMGAGLNNIVYALCVWTHGTTTELIAGGTFTNRLARWTGSAWATTLGVPNSGVLSLNVVKVAGVNYLVAGGQFTAVSGVGCFHVGKFDNASWSPFGGGISGPVWTAIAYPNDNMIAGGVFLTPTNYIARWDGAWNAMGTGMDGGVFALVMQPDGGLLAGGAYTTAGGTPASCLARWAKPGPTITQQPLSAATCASAAAPFSIVAAGSGGLTYQWQVQTAPGTWMSIGNDPLPLPCGGFASALNPFSDHPQIRITPCAGVSVYQIRCLVTDACSNVTSSAVALTVWPTGTADANNDSVSNGVDIQTFVTILVDGGATSPGYCACDFTGDGAASVDDIPGFVAYLLAI